LPAPTLRFRFAETPIPFAEPSAILQISPAHVLHSAKTHNPEELAMSESEPVISSEKIAAAETLLGLEFSPAQREQMLEIVNGRRDQYEGIRAADLDNSVPLSLNFNVSAADPAPAAVPRTYAMSAQPPVTRPADLEDAAFYTVTQLAELIRTRQVTSLELTEMYLSRLKRYDPVLECVAAYTEERAHEQAKQADAEIARGLYRGPLHGIPWGAKDLLATRGAPTQWGAKPYEGQQLDVDATVVQRLEAAGAVLIAKLTLGALANGDVWYGGTTKNPWDTGEGSSGSSAGSGAAVAGGLVGFAIGTETMGSIVSPSTRCGVSGLRPTYGRVSRYGAMALSWSMDKIGPMCRSVEDCALVFSAIYGPDGRDMTISPEPFTWDPALDPYSLRIGYVADAFKAAEAGETGAHHRPEGEDLERVNQVNSAAVLDVMREQGFELRPIELPDRYISGLWMILAAEAAAAFDQITRDGSVDTMTRQDDSAWPNVFRAARLIPAVEYINANRVRSQLMQDMARVMSDVDVFVSPSYGGNTLQITNFTGHPTVVLPNGFTDKRSPTSITFIGGLYQEAETFAVAKAYQDATDWHQQYPDLDNALEQKEDM
jgi:Asp-tRNA(Asn)/Glu-tRNA(Gln) amidotransferase A subunit family amidase